MTVVAMTATACLLKTQAIGKILKLGNLIFKITSFLTRGSKGKAFSLVSIINAVCS